MIKKHTNIGDVLHSYRILRQINIRDFALILNISTSALWRIEHGYVMDMQTWMKVMHWLFLNELKSTEKNDVGTDRNS